MQTTLSMPPPRPSPKGGGSVERTASHARCIRVRVLVTGHDGYLGAVMVPVLRLAGHEVVGLDTGFFAGGSFLQTSHPDPAPQGGRAKPFMAIRKDIRDVTEGDLARIEAVVHLAALCNDPLGDLNPEWTREINHVASVRLARLAKAAGHQRFP